MDNIEIEKINESTSAKEVDESKETGCQNPAFREASEKFKFAPVPGNPYPEDFPERIITQMTREEIKDFFIESGFLKRKEPSPERSLARTALARMSARMSRRFKRSADPRTRDRVSRTRDPVSRTRDPVSRTREASFDAEIGSTTSGNVQERTAFPETISDGICIFIVVIVLLVLFYVGAKIYLHFNDDN